MKHCLVFLILVLGVNPIAAATRFAALTNEKLVAESEWIFVGRVQRYQELPSIVRLADVKYIVRVIRSLRGTQPGFVAVQGLELMHLQTENAISYFRESTDPPVAGIHVGLLAGFGL
jgi:hypothetical protein